MLCRFVGPGDVRVEVSTMAVSMSSGVSREEEPPLLPLLPPIDEDVAGTTDVPSAIVVVCRYA